MEANSKPRVYLTRRIMEPAFDVLKQKCKITSWNKDSAVPRDLLLKEVEAVDGLYCTPLDIINEELLEKGKNLKVIATMSAGYNHIDVPACKRRGIEVGNIGDSTSEVCAELGVALVLCTTRRLIEANKQVHSGGWCENWEPIYDYMCGRRIQGSVVGIVGMGSIGTSIAEKLKAFHPKELLYNNRKPVKKLTP